MNNGIDEKPHKALSDEMTPKFLATVGADQKPNVVLVATIMPHGNDKMAFANFLLNKTAGNLDKNSKTGVIVITEELQWWAMTTDFNGWEENGPLVDTFNNNELFRYNAYTGVRNVGKLDIKDFIDKGRVGKLSLLADYAFTGMTKGKFSRDNAVDKMPLPVAEKFDRIAAVKILCYIQKDGYPVCLPILSARPSDNGTLIFGTKAASRLVKEMPANTDVAVNVVTFEPVSYQVKGRFTGFSDSLFGKKGVIEIESVWCTSPPLCGRRIDVDIVNDK